MCGKPNVPAATPLQATVLTKSRRGKIIGPSIALAASLRLARPAVQQAC
jgi:hypothetical protein